ncbi:hypothetical protein ACFL3V_03515 [Nanoarchaeota archaeon]
MRKVRHVIGIFILLVAAMLLAGCAQTLVCAPPNSIIGDKCCLDADDNSVCDAEDKTEKEEPKIIKPAETGEDEKADEVSAEQDAIDEFADTFATTWDRKSYTALHKLFVKDVNRKFTSQEFNFLARKLDKKLNIQSITLEGVDDDTATLTVIADGLSEEVEADIDEEDDEYRFEAFYMFLELTPEDACEDDESCYFSYATISNDKNYCNKAGTLKGECVAKFGVSKEITSKMDECLEILEYYGRVDCLDKLAVNENDIEPCWQATHDKQIFECMGKVAAARDDVDKCDAFVASKGYAGTRLQKAYCITGYVRETSDTAACAKIDRRSDVVLGAMQEGCYKMSFP